MVQVTEVYRPVVQIIAVAIVEVAVIEVQVIAVATWRRATIAAEVSRRPLQGTWVDEPRGRVSAGKQSPKACPVRGRPLIRRDS